MGDWWQDYYDDVDNQRLDSLEARHAKDVLVTVAGTPTLHGIADAMAGQREFLTLFKSLRHDFVNTWEIGDTAVLEAVVTYVRHDDQSVEVPCTTILHRTDDLVDSVRMYLDLAPVFA